MALIKELMEPSREIEEDSSFMMMIKIHVNKTIFLDIQIKIS
jgi:hypothetical protein